MDIVKNLIQMAQEVDRGARSTEDGPMDQHYRELSVAAAEAARSFQRAAWSSTNKDKEYAPFQKADLGEKFLRLAEAVRRLQYPSMLERVEDALRSVRHADAKERWFTQHSNEEYADAE